MFATTLDLPQPSSHECHGEVGPSDVGPRVVCFQCFQMDRDRRRAQPGGEVPSPPAAAPSGAERALTSREVGHRWRMLTHLRASRA